MTRSSTGLASRACGRARTVGIIELLAIGGIFSGFGVCTELDDTVRATTKANRLTRLRFKLENGKSRARVSIQSSVRRCPVQTPLPEKKIPPIANSSIIPTARARAKQDPCERAALANRVRVSHTADPTANSSSQRRQSAALSIDIFQATSP